MTRWRRRKEADDPGRALPPPPPRHFVSCNRTAPAGIDSDSFLFTLSGQPQAQWIRVSCLMQTSQTLSPQYQLQWYWCPFLLHSVCPAAITAPPEVAFDFSPAALFVRANRMPTGRN